MLGNISYDHMTYISGQILFPADHQAS
uniref:Uncharacterized protein n=1 Tax=Arundo donax TaxID=35708 RepID=A0A0A9GYM7_ARUDO